MLRNSSARGLCCRFHVTDPFLPVATCGTARYPPPVRLGWAPGGAGPQEWVFFAGLIWDSLVYRVLCLVTPSHSAGLTTEASHWGVFTW